MFVSFPAYAFFLKKKVQFFFRCFLLFLFLVFCIVGVFFHHDDASSFHHIYIYIKSSQSELYTLSVSVYVYIHNQIWEPDLAFVSKRDFFCVRERFSSLLCLSLIHI